VRWVTESEAGMSIGFRFADLDAAQTVALVRVITASPDWVRNDPEHRAMLGASAGRTLVGAVHAPRANPRSDVRVHTSTTALLRPLRLLGPAEAVTEVAASPGGTHAGTGRHRTASAAPVLVPAMDAPLEAAVDDVSFGGCRVHTDRRFEPGDLVSVAIEGWLATPETAEVRWVRRRRGGYVAGLQFGRTDQKGMAR
jgi:cellulose synthase (UDP-forming)